MSCRNIRFRKEEVWYVAYLWCRAVGIWGYRAEEKLFWGCNRDYVLCAMVVGMIDIICLPYLRKISRHQLLKFHCDQTTI